MIQLSAYANANPPSGLSEYILPLVTPLFHDGSQTRKESLGITIQCENKLGVGRDLVLGKWDGVLKWLEFPRSAVFVVELEQARLHLAWTLR